MRDAISPPAAAVARRISSATFGYVTEPASTCSCVLLWQALADRPDQSVAMGLAGAKKVREEHSRELWRERVFRIFTDVLAKRKELNRLRS